MLTLARPPRSVSGGLCYVAFMSFTTPDILIIPRDDPHPSMAVEARLSLDDCEATERQLKRYMVRHRCPTAMLVAPTSLRIYRDTFTSYEEGSISLVGEFPMVGVFEGIVASMSQLPEQDRGPLFEHAVRDWLDGLTDPSAVASLPPRVRDAFEAHIVPALKHGEVRSSSSEVPWKRTGS